MSRTVLLLAASALVFGACRPDARKATPAGEVGVTQSGHPMPDGKGSPIEASRVWADVEQHPTFQQQRGAACPKQLPDRSEEMRRYPTCQLLANLKFATLTAGASSGQHMKTVELTTEGRAALAADLDDRPDRLVFAVAKKELKRENVRFAAAPGRDDRVVATFYWRWAPINALGKGLNLRGMYSGVDQHQGRATYDRTAAGWALVELWLDSDTRNYMSGV
jgi:hypothetical protein